MRHHRGERRSRIGSGEAGGDTTTETQNVSFNINTLREFQTSREKVDDYLAMSDEKGDVAKISLTNRPNYRQNKSVNIHEDIDR